MRTNLDENIWEEKRGSASPEKLSWASASHVLHWFLDTTAE